jgi:hypothetical protein
MLPMDRSALCGNVCHSSCRCLHICIPHRAQIASRHAVIRCYASDTCLSGVSQLSADPHLYSSYRPDEVNVHQAGLGGLPEYPGKVYRHAEGRILCPGAWGAGMQGEFNQCIETLRFARSLTVPYRAVVSLMCAAFCAGTVTSNACAAQRPAYGALVSPWRLSPRC